MSLNSSIPTQPKLMTSTELHAMIARMDSYGGSFVSSIAQALRFADPKNRQRLLDAFPDLVQQYGPDSQFAKAKQLTQV
jgi:2-oxo-4-hydroxy-4-carboxy--5-ureidoimidazoline (OHCU) decarboxylase